MEIEKSKVLIQFLLIFRQSADVLFFPYARRLRGYTATISHVFLSSALNRSEFSDHTDNSNWLGAAYRAKCTE